MPNLGNIVEPNFNLNKNEIEQNDLNKAEPEKIKTQTTTIFGNNSNHYSSNKSTWWFDFHTMAGRKKENQDSLMMTTCLLNYIESKAEANIDLNTNPTQLITQAHQLPVLAVLADGVSACQFPKQASKLAVEIVTEYIIKGLNHLYRQSILDKQQMNEQLPKKVFDDERVAGIIKSAVVKANDSMYFSQSYQRVPPLLSTLSGVLCIEDRVYLFHTGDSRIYRFSAETTTVLSEDHRIHHGQDKGALSAALGADTRIDLQQSVFTMHQNEYLALMTDGVYEHLNPVDMQYEFNAATTKLENTKNWQFIKNWDLTKKLCHQAYEEGSNDNLSIIMLGMGLAKSLNGAKDMIDNNDGTLNTGVTTNGTDSIGKDDQSQPIQFKLPTGLEINDSIDGFKVKAIIARTARSEVYLVEDDTGHEYVLKSPSLRTVDDGEYLRSFLKERKIGLSLSRNRRAGESAYNQTDPNFIINKSNVPLNSLNDSNNRENSGNRGKASNKSTRGSSSALGESGLLRYYPVPASSIYLYHLTEYIEGESLRVFMDRNGPCDVWQTHDLLTKIGMAVRVMHRNYLLHQDIKPENILLTKSGAVKLIDFGSVASSILKDNTRPPVGDLHYAAPEYYTDAPKGVHSDLFSIAVIGYELLTAQRPFTAQELMSATSTLIVPTQLMSQKQVPATSQQALLRALHRNTNARHQAIGEFLQDFNPDNSASLTDPEPLIKRNPLLVWHGICLVQSIIIIFLLIKFVPTL
ncbi:protein kinase domain-containing protein [Psychrobacter lutiphocae]|uniref:protein kinase domain-containing protein n=1 Tax=Psychrobacter lutiphocae TaxID=540500 RepID=UPI000378ED63|nr:protein kinase [Psychrobacter lutiphocae]